MKSLIVIAALICVQAHAQNRVVYGHDNRKDLFLVNNPLQRELARSTAILVANKSFRPTANRDIYDIESTTLEIGKNLCPGQRFSQQPKMGTCSGFLVGPDTLVTAGHCYISDFTNPEKKCAESSWVFDRAMYAPDARPDKNVSIADIYGCKQVIATQRNGDIDFAVIKLDRPVVGRPPLNFRVAGKVPDQARLVVIGHPSGIPTKVSGEGRIFKNTYEPTFVTNLDTFAGNSGSAVFDVNTGMVEGILISGRTDYIPSNPKDVKSCKVVNKCKTNGEGCLGGKTSIEGEKVYRIGLISGIIQQAFRTR